MRVSSVLPDGRPSGKRVPSTTAAIVKRSLGFGQPQSTQATTEEAPRRVTCPERFHAPRTDAERQARLLANGDLTWDEYAPIVAGRLERRERALAAQRRGARTFDPRADRPTPSPSIQWAQPMDTQAARDTRVTPGARALLQIIVAEIGNHGSRILNNAYLAKRMSLSVRTVQRYISKLADPKISYIRVELVRSRAGLDIGRRIRLVAERVRPFWHPERRRAVAKPEAGQNEKREFRSFSGVTVLSPTNDPTGQKDQSGKRAPIYPQGRPRPDPG